MNESLDKLSPEEIRAEVENLLKNKEKDTLVFTTKTFPSSLPFEKKYVVLTDQTLEQHKPNGTRTFIKWEDIDSISEVNFNEWEPQETDKKSAE